MISLRTKRKALNIDKNALVGKVTRNSDNLDENSFLIIDNFPIKQWKIVNALLILLGLQSL